MQTSRIILAMLLCSALAGSVFAQSTPTAQSQGGTPQKSGCPPYSDGRKFDATPIVDAIDTNKDAMLTHEEWSTAGAPENSWNSFMKKEKVLKQGYITREDFLAETPPGGIDTDCNGKITIEEFRATIKMGAPGGARGGSSPAGAPPQK